MTIPKHVRLIPIGGFADAYWSVTLRHPAHILLHAKGCDRGYTLKEATFLREMLDRAIAVARDRNKRRRRLAKRKSR